MNSINDINIRLEQMRSLLNDNERRLDLLKKEINETMNKVQNDFGTSREGQDIVKLLYEVIISVSKTDAEINIMNLSIRTYEGKLSH